MDTNFRVKDTITITTFNFYTYNNVTLNDLLLYILKCDAIDGILKEQKNELFVRGNYKIKLYYVIASQFNDSLSSS